MKVQSLSLFLAAAVVVIIGSPVWAQSPSCVTATVMSSGAIVGVVSYSPMVTDPNGCIDQAHSIGDSFGIVDNGESTEETLFHDTATITSVSISTVFENNCSLVGVNPTVSGSGQGQFSDFNGTHGGYIYFGFSTDSGVQNLEGTAEVQVQISDSTGNYAQYPVYHVCPAAPGGGGEMATQPLLPPGFLL